VREIYSGSFSVSGSNYTESNEDGDEVEIEKLDERVTSVPILHFTLDYPFERPFEGKVVTDAGATLRQILDAIRAGYRTMYSGTTVESIPNLDNKRVRGEFGEAFHVIEDLVVEYIAIDEEEGALDVGIGS
jgi:hypothetical protein